MAAKLTLSLRDETGVAGAQAYVAGWINGGSANFQVLQAGGSFGGSAPITQLPFYPVSSFDKTDLLVDVATNGNDRLLFVVATATPAARPVANLAPVGYPQYPYAVLPAGAAPGPFDIFEFGVKAAADVSAVNGFGLNLRFNASPPGPLKTETYGVSPAVTRKQIGTAFKAFVANEAKSQPGAHAFGGLLYDGAIAVPGAPAPPSVGGQFFALCDPSDLLDAYTQNYTQRTGHGLATYWDATLAKFFTVGRWLSLNLSAGAANIYSGQCTDMPQYGGPTYTLSNGSHTYFFPCPLNSGLNPLGFSGAKYVFMQAFDRLTPSGAGGDAGVLQANIWEALCRGVAQDGVKASQISNGESTTAWNQWRHWYRSGTVCDLYGKFLHYAAADGSDGRVSHQPPIFLHNAAYAFGMDESPDGPYAGGPQVPSKTTYSLPEGSAISITVGLW